MNVAVIGTGYVGLVTGTCLAELGHRVICVDAVQSKIDALNQGQVPIYEPGLEDLIQRNVAQRRLQFTVDTATAVAGCDVVFIAVGTPPGPDGSADLTFVRDVAHSIGRAMTGYCVVVNKSTVPVGTAGLVAGIIAEETTYPADVVSNPEFLREGSAIKDAFYPDRIVVGTRSEKAAAILKELYRSLTAPMLVTDPRSAEMIKYAANAFLSVKISFINEISGLCERLGADVEQVASGIGMDKRIGAAFLKAGLGYGGSCFPKDTNALVEMARQAGYSLPVVEGAMVSNWRQRTAMVDKVRRALGSLDGKVIGILGLAFKPNTDDVRQAAALDLMRMMTGEGALIRAYDPKALETGREAWAAYAGADMDAVTFCASGGETAQGADALILVTEWPEFLSLDWAAMRGAMKQGYLFDGRNLLDPVSMSSLGFQYTGVGRGVAEPFPTTVL